MKLLLSRSDPKAVSWLDRYALDLLQQIAASLGGAEDVVEVTFVDDQFIRRINRDYRGVDRATDVIAFSYMEDEPRCEENITGEVYVSCETVEKEAKEQAVDTRHLFLRVALHGLLHVLGYDHRTEEAALGMEAEEKRLLEMHLDRGAIDALY